MKNFIVDTDEQENGRNRLNNTTTESYVETNLFDLWTILTVINFKKT